MKISKTITPKDWDANIYIPRPEAVGLGLIVNHWKKNGSFNIDLYLRFCDVKTGQISQTVKP